MPLPGAWDDTTKKKETKEDDLLSRYKAEELQLVVAPKRVPGYKQPVVLIDWSRRSPCCGWCCRN